MPRKALGRGLDALIPSGEGGEGGGITLCEVEKIRPSPLQPRVEFETGSLEGLAESIKSNGVLQPLIVRTAKEGYELIAGERRLRAARMAGLAQVPVLIKETDDKGALELSLVENIQRENLGPLEEAEAYRRLVAEFGYTQDQLAQRVGKDRATVANQMRLLSLPDEVKKDLAEHRITPGHARAIMMAGTKMAMLAIRKAVLEQGISVREAERRARGEKKKGPAPSAKNKKDREALYVKDLEEGLTKELSTKVRIKRAAKGGRIEIHFYSEEELDRICRRIKGGR